MRKKLGVKLLLISTPGRNKMNMMPKKWEEADEDEPVSVDPDSEETEEDDDDL